MPTRPASITLAYAAFILTACSPSPAQFSIADRTAITQTSNQYLDAFVDGDWETYAQLFTQDAQQLSSEGGLRDGRAQIRSEMEQTEIDFVDAQSSNVLVDGSGDLAYRWMDYRLVSAPTDTAATQSTFQGRLLSVYERQADGSWLIVADTWSPQQPPAPSTDATSS